jgi:hypothetical protein
MTKKKTAPAAALKGWTAIAHGSRFATLLYNGYLFGLSLLFAT